MSSILESQRNSFSLGGLFVMVWSEYFDELLFTKSTSYWVSIFFKEYKDGV